MRIIWWGFGFVLILCIVVRSHAEETLWKLHIPVGAQWQIHIVAKEHLTSSVRKYDLLLEMDGHFTLSRLPSERTFSDFLLKHPEPAETGNPYDDFILLEDWAKNFFADGYGGVEGEISGKLTWTELPGKFNATSSIIFEYEGLPTQVYSITGVVRGGCWIDGLHLFVGPSSDPFEFKTFRQTKMGIMRIADGSVKEVTDEVEVDFPRLDLPPLESTLNSLSVTETEIPQSYIEYDIPYIGSRRVSINLKPDCPVELTRFDVNTVRITPDWSPDNSLSSSEIAALYEEITGSAINSDFIQLGWTHSDIPPKKPLVEIEWGAKPSQLDPSVVCLYVDRFNVEQRLAVSMYIADKYGPSTCLYKALLGHEMKHADGFTKATDAYLISVKKALLESTAIPSKALPLRVTRSAVFQEQDRIT